MEERERAEREKGVLAPRTPSSRTVSTSETTYSGGGDSNDNANHDVTPRLLYGLPDPYSALGGGDALHTPHSGTSYTATTVSLSVSAPTTTTATTISDETGPAPTLYKPRKTRAPVQSSEEEVVALDKNVEESITGSDRGGEVHPVAESVPPSVAESVPVPDVSPLQDGECEQPTFSTASDAAVAAVVAVVGPLLPSARRSSVSVACGADVPDADPLNPLNPLNTLNTPNPLDGSAPALWQAEQDAAVAAQRLADMTARAVASETMVVVLVEQAGREGVVSAEAAGWRCVVQRAARWRGMRGVEAQERERMGVEEGVVGAGVLRVVADETAAELSALRETHTQLAAEVPGLQERAATAEVLRERLDRVEARLIATQNASEADAASATAREQVLKQKLATLMKVRDSEEALRRSAVEHTRSSTVHSNESVEQRFARVRREVLNLETQPERQTCTA